MRSSISSTIASGLLIGLIQGNPVTAAEIKVLCTQALRTSVTELAPRFERATGHKVDVSVAPSGKLVARVRDGEQADFLIANAPNIDGLQKDGKISGTRIDLARAQVGLAVRIGAPKPDISSPEAVKRALLAAKAVAYVAGGLSGNIFEAALDKLGIAHEIKAKAKAGAPAAGFVARGEADIAAQQISELIAVQGVELVGPLPAELGGTTQFSMGLLASAKERSTAEAFMKFLRSEEAAGVIKAKGLTPG
ncbi:MAG: molybdate ABC transporter substrate-binding protein [Rhizobiales bacterium]|nr:molybdate ABC transporter substrate-binding protein [Hyphomicrobiales bacterium]